MSRISIQYRIDYDYVDQATGEEYSAHHHRYDEESMHAKVAELKLLSYVKNISVTARETILYKVAI